MVEADNLAQNVDDLGHPLVPGLLAFPFASGIPDILVVGLVSADRVMGELEMRQDLAVAKERRPGPGPERQHHLQPLALDRTKTLDIGIVEHADRLAQMFGEHRLQIEPGQGVGAEIGRGDNPPLTNITREAD